MDYHVQLGDSLWSIAERQLGDAQKWREIAQDNHLAHPETIVVGQRLLLRGTAVQPAAGSGSSSNRNTPSPFALINQPEQTPSLIPGRFFFFVVADEFNPLRQKVVRKVIVNEKLAAELSTRLGKPVPFFPNPEEFGFFPTDPLSTLPPGRHALGMKPSPYSSASASPFGASRIEGNRFWIDVEKAKEAGATFHDTDEILADLDRIAKKSANAATRARIEEIRRLVLQDQEVLLRGPVPASAIKGVTSMALTRGMLGLQIVGFVMTAIDLDKAAHKSVAKHSVRPLAAETVRQAGGWASAWAGAKLCGTAAAAVGIESGPFDLLIGLGGAVVGGVGGYYGFGWIADHIDSN